MASTNNVDQHLGSAFRGGRPKPAVTGPRNMETDHQFRHSTKQLISRYESMMPPAAPSPRPVSSGKSAAKFVRAISASKENLPIARKQDRSPLRQSFTNLLSVFKIGNIKNSGKDGNSRSLSGFVKASSPLGSHSGYCNSTVSQSESNVKQALFYTGALLYLSRPQVGHRASLILPVWTDSSVELKSGEILITWLTTQGNPFTHAISLASCTDVRSLSLHQLDASEMALLPTRADSEEVRVFELLFEGRPRERFAATSLQERAGWVSAIWDAILASQGRLVDSENMGSKTAQPGAHQSRMGSEQSRVSCEEFIAGAIKCDTTHHLERSLPPTPVETVSSILPPLLDIRYTLSDDKVVALHTAAQQASETKGDSAVNPVEEKPAQIDIDTASRIQDTRKIGDISRMSSIRRSNSGKTGLHHQCSLRSDGGYSIIDSYGDTGSPILTSIDQAGKSISVTSEILGCPIPDENLADAHSTALDSPASQYPAFTDSGLDSLTELLRGQAGQITTFREKLCSIHDLLQAFSLPTNTLTDAMPLLADITQVVKDIHRKTDCHEDEMRVLHDQLSEIGYGVQRQQVSLGTCRSDTDTLKRLLEDVWHQLRSEFPKIIKALEEIYTTQADRESADSRKVTMQNVNPSGYTTDDFAEPGGLGCHEQPTLAFQSMLEGKLDELLSLHQDARSSDSNNHPTHAEPGLANFQQATDELRAVLNSLNDEASRRTLREQQQEDSVRYLNELNSWLETFVKNSTVQMQETTFGVRKLCHEFGSDVESSDLSRSDPDAKRSQTVLGDIRQLILETRKREADFADLKQSVDALVCLINRNADGGNGFTPETVIGLLNRQRQDQEGLLRALTAELSSEIRGERLRFVEAMKEATAINVQIHVEQFKKELNREVMVMTREIERLHREKQAVENQIADLFAFYSKHKQPATSQPVTPQQPHVKPAQRYHYARPQHNQQLPGYHHIAN